MDSKQQPPEASETSNHSPDRESPIPPRVLLQKLTQLADDITASAEATSDEFASVLRDMDADRMRRNVPCASLSESLTVAKDKSIQRREQLRDQKGDMDRMRIEVHRMLVLRRVGARNKEDDFICKEAQRQMIRLQNGYNRIAEETSSFVHSLDKYAHNSLLE